MKKCELCGRLDETTFHHFTFRIRENSETY